MRKQVILYLMFSLSVLITSHVFSEQIKLSLDLEIKEPENISPDILEWKKKVE